MISEIDKSISFQNSRNVAAELLKTLKRDVPFETEADILAAHARLTNALYAQYCDFIGESTGIEQVVATVPFHSETYTNVTEGEPAMTSKAEVKKEAPAKAVTTSDAAVLAMVQKAVDASTTKVALTELKAKVLKATKISLQDQSELLAKIDAKIGVL